MLRDFLARYSATPIPVSFCLRPYLISRLNRASNNEAEPLCGSGFIQNGCRTNVEQVPSGYDHTTDDFVEESCSFAWIALDHG